jgi:hypothetical protein
MLLVLTMVPVNGCSCLCCGVYLAEPAVLPAEAPLRCQATVCAGPGVGNACAPATRQKNRAAGAERTRLTGRGLECPLPCPARAGHVLPALALPTVA